MRKFRAVLAAMLVTAVVVATGGTAAAHGNPNPGSVIFPRHAHPYGASMATWGQRTAQWYYGQPAATNPFLDETGARCGNGQRGRVWFLPPIPGPSVEHGEWVCKIPRGRAILLDIGMDVMDYPCPDPAFRPAPGQSLYDFLIEQDKPIMDSVDKLDVTIDGRAMRDVLGYRYISPRLFAVKGDLSMRAVDPCVTGRPQPAVIDGFLMMVKPPRPGHHVIVVHGTNTFGDDKTYVYRLTVGRPAGGR